MILDRFKLTGKVAIVTGAGRGLGRAMACGLAEAGADLALVGSTTTDATAQAVRAAGRRVCQIQANLLQPAAVAGIVERTVTELGGVDILVNNAGIIRRAPALEFSEADWDDVLHINLKALFFMAQAAAKIMAKQGGGKIINVASMLSFQGGVIVPSYTAAKSGVAGVTRALANEWAKYHINVNAIAPGYMATANTAALRADPVRSAAILDRIPAGRWGTPDDLKGVVVLLASPASDYLCGAIVPVDGGWLTR